MRTSQFNKHLRRFPFLWWELTKPGVFFRKPAGNYVPHPKDIAFIAARPWESLILSSHLACDQIKAREKIRHTLLVATLKECPLITYRVIWQVPGEEFYRHQTVLWVERVDVSRSTNSGIAVYSSADFGDLPTEGFPKQFRRKFGPAATLIAVVRIFWARKELGDPPKPKEVEIYPYPNEG